MPSAAVLIITAILHFHLTVTSALVNALHEKIFQHFEAEFSF